MNHVHSKLLAPSKPNPTKVAKMKRQKLLDGTNNTPKHLKVF